MNRFLAYAVIACMFATLIGCGGLTQEDMKRHAIRRPSDDEDDSPVARPHNDASPAIPPKDSQLTETAVVDVAPVTAASSTNGAMEKPQPEASFPQPSESQFPRVSPPADPLELTERRRRSIENMEKIGTAIQKRIEEKRTIPAAAILSSSGRPLLSWRVELLPYLGHGELYQQFHLDEPWDSPHNKLLLPFIPHEYQSPERFDERTNYLAPVASFAAFQGTRGLGVRRIEDGLENTVVVVEADDDNSVPWTKPQDLVFNLYRLHENVGNLRQDGFFVIWGTGEVTRVRPDATDAELRAIFTVDAGEPISSFAIRAEATAEPELSSTHEDEEVAADVGTKPAAVANSDDDGESSSLSAAGGEPARWPVPDDKSLNEAKLLFRDIYQQEYDAAKTLKDKEKLARKLLNEANRMKEDYSGRYVLLEIIVKIASQAGDASTALDAADQMAADYEVDELKLKLSALETLIKTEESGKGAGDILAAATEMIDVAIELDDYDSAEVLCGVAIAAARKNDDRRGAKQMERRKYHVRDAKQAYAAVRRVVERLGDDDDPAANLEVGRYYCLVKSNWERGLPLLVKCDDATLRDLAEQEMRSPILPADQLRLADGWWSLAEQKESHEKALQLRAAYWYLRAIDDLPHGLHRVKAEMRVRQAEDKYGKEEVAELLAAG